MTMTMATTRIASDQPAVRLPTVRLVSAVVVAGALAAAGWWASAALLAGDQVEPRLAIAAWAVVAGCTVAGVLAIGPWKPRPVSRWITMWLAQTVLRMLLTPIVAFVVARAGAIDLMSLAVPLGITYLAAVVCEALVVSRFLKSWAAA